MKLRRSKKPPDAHGKDSIHILPAFPRENKSLPLRRIRECIKNHIYDKHSDTKNTQREMEYTYLISHLHTGYRSRGGRVSLVSDMSTKLNKGELTCLIGVNGAGKSTLLRTMAGLLKPLGGDIELMGKPLGQYSAQELSKTVSVVLTDEIPEQTLRVFETVAMGRMPYTGYWGDLGSEDTAHVDKALEMVGMADFADRRLDSLSDGERQKVVIAKALAQDTDVILLDEPVAFLDFPSKVSTLRLLRSVAHESGKSVLLSIHDIELALKIADWLWILQGDTFLEGMPRQLAEAGKIDFLFQGEGISFNRLTLQYSIN